MTDRVWMNPALDSGAFIKESQVPYIREFDTTGERKPYTKIYTFVKNNASMTRISFKEVFDTLSDYLTNQGVNFGILLTPDGTFVFTEHKVKFDAVMVKLATGINFGKQVNNAKAELAVVNTGLKRI